MRKILLKISAVFTALFIMAMLLTMLFLLLLSLIETAEGTPYPFDFITLPCMYGAFGMLTLFALSVFYLTTVIIGWLDKIEQLLEPMKTMIRIPKYIYWVETDDGDVPPQIAKYRVDSITNGADHEGNEMTLIHNEQFEMTMNAKFCCGTLSEAEAVVRSLGWR